MVKILIIIISYVTAINSQLIVNTQYGPIRGTQRTSALNKNYLSFHKIPYMKAPVGKLRFRDAIPPDNWTEPLDCTQEGPRFPQVDVTWEPPNAPIRGDLDSMHINIFTKNLNPMQKYPVMVWIHGGGFRVGSGLKEVYGPDYFMERDVILVTFNYRLYAFGFLSLDDPSLSIPGNAGLKDQVMALKWIKNNIENFGGDSKNITIFGQSSGGASAHYHLLSEASKDLFQRSIIMSGTAFNPIYAAIPRRNWAERLAKQLGYVGDANEKNILSFLEEADPEDIFEACKNLLTDHEQNVERLINAFGPVIEPYSTENAFMLAHPEELAKTAWGNDKDIMIGATSFETGALVPVILQVPFITQSLYDFTTWVPYNLNKTEEERESDGNLLKLTYYGQLDPTPTNFEPVTILSGEFAHWHVIDRIVKQRLRSNNQALNWVYRFDANADNNCFRLINNIPPAYYGHRRAIHMDDLCYLFKPEFIPNIPTSQSFELIQHMLDIYTKFAATGNPGIDSWVPSKNYSATLVGYNIREERSLDTFDSFDEIRRLHVWQQIYGDLDQIEDHEGNGSGNIKISIILIALSFVIFIKSNRII